VNASGVATYTTLDAVGRVAPDDGRVPSARPGYNASAASNTVTQTVNAAAVNTTTALISSTRIRTPGSRSRSRRRSPPRPVRPRPRARQLPRQRDRDRHRHGQRERAWRPRFFRRACRSTSPAIRTLVEVERYKRECRPRIAGRRIHHAHGQDGPEQRRDLRSAGSRVWCLTATRDAGTKDRDGKKAPVRERTTFWVHVADKPRS